MNAQTRAPDGPWLRTWLLALMLAAGALTALECFWRTQGYRASSVDDPALWSYHRSRAVGGREKVVLLGDSRMALDIDTSELRRLLPHRDVRQLAVHGKAPMAALRDLAADEGFAGIVICSAPPADFELWQREKQQHVVDWFRGVATWNAEWNRYLGALLEERFVVLNPAVRSLETVSQWLDGNPPPEPGYVIMRADRSEAADFASTDAARIRAARIARRRAAYRDHPAPLPRQWFGAAADAAPWVARIRARGGAVVFVRFPTTGEHWEMDQQHYPRAFYWDRLAAATGAETVHFADVPGMAGLDCPDTSHLDYRDAPAFTRALVAELARRGVWDVAVPGGSGEAAAPR